MSKNNSDEYIEFVSVNDLNNAIKQTIEPFYKSVKITGEISNFKISNNNLFATLKDNESAISVTYWGYGYRKEKTEIINGNTVTIQGKITVYPKTGNYCLLANKISKLGTGDVYKEYEELKQKYENMGYFKNKKQFPLHINTIGIVTSLEGAALQDILYVLKNNKFIGRVIIKNCMVQGKSAPKSIRDAIKSMNNLELDLMIIGRGGGSFEDLLAFSSPEVIEAIRNCPVYTISAVGHEIDYMISDFVADYRAPTPSVAAEIVASYSKNQLLEYNKYKSFVETQMSQIILSQIDSYKNKISLLNKTIQNPVSQIEKLQNDLDKIKMTLISLMTDKIRKEKDKINHLSNKLNKYDITEMLQKGYVVMLKNNCIIDSINDLKSGQKLKIKMKDGEAIVIVSTLKIDNPVNVILE